MLLLGGIDYGADPAGAPEKARRKTFPGQSRSVKENWHGDFKQLDATEGEIASVAECYRDLFGDPGITVLKGAAASEESFALLLPNTCFCT